MDDLLRFRCSILQAQAREAFADDGYDDLVAFSRNSYAQIESYVKTVNKYEPRLPLAGPGRGGGGRGGRGGAGRGGRGGAGRGGAGRGDGVMMRPKVPNSSVILLKALRLWVIWQQRMGIPEPDPDDYTEEQAEWALARYQFEEDLLTNKEKAPDAPDKFTNFHTGWRTFKDGVMGMLFAVRGAMNIPLQYVLRDHDEVTPEMREIEYLDSDEFLMAVVAVSPPTTIFKADNTRVWNLIYPLIHNTNAWEYVKQFESKKNARAAWKILTGRGEGESQRDTKQVSAERALMTLMYDGSHKRYTWSTHLNKVLKAFNDLHECGKPKSDYDKVTSLFHTCKGDMFKTIRGNIFSNDDLKYNFDKCIAHIEMQMQFESTSPNAIGDRNVSSTSTSQGKKSKSDFKFLPNEQWAKMSKEERAAYIKEQKEKRSVSSTTTTTTSSKRQQKKQRRLAALAQEILDAADDDNDDDDDNDKKPAAKKTKVTFATGSPADQFGRHASAIKLAKIIKAQNSNTTK